MIIPLRTDSPLRRTPYMNWALIAANFAVFFVELAYNPDQPGDSSFTRPLILQPSNPHLWQYFTYAFLHAGWLHIIGNMLFLYIFGNNICDRLGNLGYLAFYLAGGVFAGIGYVVVENHIGGGGVLGASGAVAAVTGAFLILMPHSRITIVYFLFFVGVIEIPALWVILFFFLTDVLGQVAPEYVGGAEAVAHMAHISGTIFGALICFILLAVGLLPRDQFDVVALLSRWNRRRVYRDVVAGGFDPFGFSPARQVAAGSRLPPPPPDAAMQRQIELRSAATQALTEHDLPRAAALYQQMIASGPEQVLSRTSQLDIANFFAHEQRYPEAAAAYEQFLRYYANYEQIEQIHLMLGVIYSRYLNNPSRAKDYLQRALSRLHTAREVELAKSELAHVEGMIPPST
jgi:membrane associated rhomboid family serine protease